MSAPARFDANRALDLWAAGKTGPEIADIIGHHPWTSIVGRICVARKQGDPRAVSRAPARVARPKPVPVAPPPPPKLLCPEFGIEAVTHSVPNAISLGSTGPTHRTVSLARVRSLETAL